MNKQREGHLCGVFISGNKGLSWRNRAGILIDVSDQWLAQYKVLRLLFKKKKNRHTHTHIYK